MNRLDAQKDSFDDIYNQLCEFYDICDKYNIEDFDKLDKTLENGIFINNGTEAILDDTIELVNENEQLKQQLVEKDNQTNQKVIEELTKVQMYISDNAVYAEDDIFGREINNFIDKRIKELKGEE